VLYHVLFIILKSLVLYKVTLCVKYIVYFSNIKVSKKSLYEKIEKCTQIEKGNRILLSDGANVLKGVI